MIKIFIRGLFRFSIIATAGLVWLVGSGFVLFEILQRWFPDCPFVYRFDFLPLSVHFVQLGVFVTLGVFILYGIFQLGSD